MPRAIDKFRLNKSLYRLAALFFFCFLVAGNVKALTITPSWFNPTDFDVEMTGTLGLSDIDVFIVGTKPAAHINTFLENHGGGEWFAWMETSSPTDLALNYWSGLNPALFGVNCSAPCPRFDGHTKIDSDVTSSPLGQFPALGGVLTPGETLILAICAVEDPNCEKTNFTQGNIDFTLRFAFNDTVVSAPNVFMIVFLGALATVLNRNRQKIFS